MKGFPKLQEFIQSNSRGQESKESLARIKIQYRKAYYKEYNSRRKLFRIITLRMSEKEFQLILKSKESYGQSSLNQFLKEIIHSYLNKSLVIPHKKEVSDLMTAINRIGNNINQIVHKLHIQCLRMEANTGIANFNIESMYRILKGFEILKDETDKLKTLLIDQSCQINFELVGIKWEHIKQNQDGKLDQLICYLTEHRNSL